MGLKDIGVGVLVLVLGGCGLHHEPRVYDGGFYGGYHDGQWEVSERVKREIREGKADQGSGGYGGPLGTVPSGPMTNYFGGTNTVPGGVGR